MSDAVAIRPAERADVPLLFRYVRDLAEYERAPDRVVGTEQLLEDALFGAQAVAEALVAEVGGEPRGFAVFYTTFSTWLCLPGIWLEDLFVPPEHRGSGVGLALLARVAAIAVERGYGRLEWTALDWNAPAIGFYEALGSEQLHEWQTFRLDGEALRRVARRSPSPDHSGCPQ